MIIFRIWESPITLNSNIIIFARMQPKHLKHLLLTLLTSKPKHDLIKGHIYVILLRNYCVFPLISARLQSSAARSQTR